MIEQEKSNTLCDTMYAIRDCINDDDTLGALSLANDLYFMLLRVVIEDGKVSCGLKC